MRICILSFVLACTCICSAEAQLIGRRAPRGEKPPKALLVELLTRNHQREFLAAHRRDLLPEFEHDVLEVARRTLLDFSRYFDYCPVYFFIDTMANRVAAGDWDGVLLDSLLRPVQHTVLKPGDKNFFIAYYGTPIPQPDSVRPRSVGLPGGSTEGDGDDATALFREKLLVHDADFRLLPESGPRTNYIRALRLPRMTSREYRAYRRAIMYNTDRWYIDYMPVAYSYSETLRRYFRERK